MGGCWRIGVGINQSGEICGVNVFNVSEGDGPLFFGFGQGGMDIKNYSFMVRNGEFKEALFLKKNPSLNFSFLKR